MDGDRSSESRQNTESAEIQEKSGMTAFDRAWRIAKEEVPIEPFNMDLTGNHPGLGGIRSSKSVHQARDVPLKDGTIVPTAYQVLHEIDGTVTYFSPEAFAKVSGPRDLWDGDLTHLVADHICDGCGDQLDMKSEEEFEEGFTDGICWDCQGRGVDE